ncbi:MAG: cyanophycinase [Veillonellales bacterium]
MEKTRAGNLVIIGGNEDKQGDCLILRKFMEIAGGRQARIAVLTTATELPREVGDEYRNLFTQMGVDNAPVLYINNRESANDRHQIREIDNATGIFITGGDQLRLTSILGGSGVDAALRRAFSRGTVIAGTSAGASVMSDTMIVGGDSSDTPKKLTLSMAHGMGLLAEVVIDQHFAQRGRINRLLAAVAQNPHILGIGIDEDTALVVEAGGKCQVIGSQTVTILDGKNIIHSNIFESKRQDPLAITNMSLHVLPSGYGYDISRRIPFTITGKREEQAEPEQNY